MVRYLHSSYNEYMKNQNELYTEIKTFIPKNGEMAFWWLGQMGFAMKIAGKLLLVDAFLSPHRNRTISPALDVNNPELADYVLGTHDHIDHIDRKAWIQIAKASMKTKFIVPQIHRDSVIQELNVDPVRVIGIDEEISYTDGNLTIKAIPSAHEFLDTDPISGLHPHVGYIIEAEGLRLYHSGDSCIYEGIQTKLRGFEYFDVMFVPINGRDGVRYRRGTIGNMTTQEAVDLVGVIKPGLAVPGHYEMFEGNPGDPNLFSDYLEAKYPGIACWIGDHGIRVDVKKR